MDLVKDALRLEEKATDLAVLPSRLALGATMAYHGAQKLTPAGISQHVGFFEQVGLKPGRPFVIATGIAEVLAGATSLLGIGTRIGAVAALVTQAGAVAKVHASKGFANTKGGFEFNLALMAMALGLLAMGPGEASARTLVRKRVEAHTLRSLLLRRKKRSLLGQLALAI